MTIPPGLRFHHGWFAEAADQTAYRNLMHDVLGLSPGPTAEDDWMPFAVFDADGACVASVEASVLSLVVDGAVSPCAGIRSVAVDPAWRGRGLFRALIGEAMSRSAEQGAGLTLLYTAEPALYERFGFRPVAQHAFLGPAPGQLSSAPAGTGASRSPSDLQIAWLLARRAPVSLQAALLVGPALFMANLAGDDAPMLAHCPKLDAAIAFEDDDDTLVIADVVAPEIPPLADLLGALGKRPRRVKTLFPPDRLGWQGEPVLEETGLMVHGRLPAALTSPFMFPPTTEF